MASASIPAARPAATPAAVAAYIAEGHTQAQAAAHFQCSDRYIRKMLSRARDQAVAQTPATASQRPVAASIAPILPITPAEPEKPAYATVATMHDSAIAHGHELWRCRFCLEYLNPTPGTTGRDWRENGCYICSTRRAAPPVIMSREQDQDQHAAPVVPEPDQEQEPQQTRPRLIVPVEQEHANADAPRESGPVEHIPAPMPTIRPRTLDDAPRPMSPTYRSRRDVPRLDVLGMTMGIEWERIAGVPLAVIVALVIIVWAFAGAK